MFSLGFVLLSYPGLTICYNFLSKFVLNIFPKFLSFIKIYLYMIIHVESARNEIKRVFICIKIVQV